MNKFKRIHPHKSFIIILLLINPPECASVQVFNLKSCPAETVVFLMLLQETPAAPQ